MERRRPRNVGGGKGVRFLGHTTALGGRGMKLERFTTSSHSTTLRGSSTSYPSSRNLAM